MKKFIVHSPQSIVKNIFLSVFSAVLLSLPFSSGKLWITSWFGFVPLFFALRNKSRLQAFFLAYICGVVFWSVTIYWLVHVTFIGTFVLILYLALYFGVFGLLLSTTNYELRTTNCLFVPSTWVLLEYLRSYLFTGFPWALLGLSQYKNLPVIQIADITGAWGVSFLVMMMNVWLYQVLGSRFLVLGKTGIKNCIFVLLFLALALGYGYYKLNLTPRTQHQESIKISVIQGNIPQAIKWDWRARNFILNNYKELTSESAKGSPALIIWPEASVPGVFGEDDAVFGQVFSLVRGLKIDLLIGTVSWRSGNYFNSALLIDKTGKPGEIYNKLHLVPFGEFVPFKKTFPFLQAIAPIGDIQPGREFAIFQQPCNFGVLICFEDLFPELSREFVKRGAKFLVNITNDAWYKEGSAPYQHFAASIFRSVENRVYLARAANTGISGFIDPAGRILSVVRNQGKEIFVQGYRSQSICLAAGKRTIYNRYGDF
ncbi:MAG: apolipoprotein N-acyltransferase, partial [Candidatus Omnitrophota bacterium]|nr:apolipoprotein N-acyltransferase [Candidatus Omnitrophota bacterium]